MRGHEGLFGSLCVIAIHSAKRKFVSAHTGREKKRHACGRNSRIPLSPRSGFPARRSVMISFRRTSISYSSCHRTPSVFESRNGIFQMARKVVDTNNGRISSLGPLFPISGRFYISINDRQRQIGWVLGVVINRLIGDGHLRIRRYRISAVQISVVTRKIRA